MQIKRERLAQRCEICHQSDCFDAVNNICTRCHKVNIPTQSTPARYQHRPRRRNRTTQTTNTTITNNQYFDKSAHPALPRWLLIFQVFKNYLVCQITGWLALFRREIDQQNATNPTESRPGESGNRLVPPPATRKISIKEHSARSQRAPKLPLPQRTHNRHEKRYQPYTRNKR